MSPDGPDGPGSTVLTTAVCGEAGLRVVVTGEDAEAVWARVHRLARALNAGDVPGLHSAVPTYDAVLLDFDAVATDHVAVERAVAALDTAGGGGAQAASRTWRVPTCFEGEHAPDLAFVADHLGLTPAEVVAAACAEDLVLRCLGGPAASAMTDGPRLPAPVPRWADPRVEVPAGAVSLAGRQAVVGPVPAPSGWRQVGRTPVRMLDVAGSPVVPYAAGDRVRLEPIDPEAFDALAGTSLVEVNA